MLIGEYSLIEHKSISDHALFILHESMIVQCLIQNAVHLNFYLNNISVCSPALVIGEFLH